MKTLDRQLLRVIAQHLEILEEHIPFDDNKLALQHANIQATIEIELQKDEPDAALLKRVREKDTDEEVN